MIRRYILLLLLFILVGGCSSSPPPPHTENLCHLFLQNPHWLWAVEKAEDRWHVPVSLIMAIMFQESHFKKGAEPARRKIFKTIPWLRSTTAEGYPQATDETWRIYCKNRHRVSADRDSFADAADFIGWYVSYAHGKLRVAKTDAYTNYLAYHEGMRGYAEQSFKHKYWLKHVAHKVERHAAVYHQQLMGCQYKLPAKPWWY